MSAEYEDLPRSGFAGYFSARGLASRKQFWAIVLIVFIANISLHSLFDAMLYQGGKADGIIELATFATFATVVVTVWITLATSIRRAKDAGMSPWLAILMLIPGVSLVILIVLGSMSSKSR